MGKRDVEIVLVSDVHLGTYGCNAKALNKYLKSIKPKILILNGDIIDIWQFRKRYWPQSHMKVVQRIFKLLSEDVQVYYLTGNHDEMPRRFTDFKMGKLEIINKLVLSIDGKRAWIFHGDVFDVTMKHSKWLAKLGAIGYDTLILINSFANWCMKLMGKGKVSFSKKIKNKVKQAIKFIDDFETTATDIAIEKGYDYVICGHIHQPQIREVKNENGSTLYLNSGDWVENLTSLEYHEGKWSLYQHAEEHDEDEEDELTKHIPDMDALLKTITNIS